MISVLSTSTEVMLQKLRTVFATHGFTEILESDNSFCFTSADFKEFISRNGIKHITSAPYHPASNRLVERANQTFKKAISKEKPVDIESQFSRFLFHYRNVPHKTTGSTPAELLLKRKLRTHLTLMQPDLKSWVFKRVEALLNIYMSSLLAPQDNVTFVSYADNITIMSSAVQPEQACTAINNYLVLLATWLEQHNLILIMGKSSDTLFTTWTKQLKTPLNMSVAGAALPTCLTVKVLGVTFDGILTFSHHVKRTQAKVRQHNNIFKKLAGPSWGCSKEVLLTTYKAVGCSIINYSAPIWIHTLSDCRCKDLHRKQNVALRTITICHIMASELHLHHEAKIMPVKQHNTMLSPQFLLGAHKV